MYHTSTRQEVDPYAGQYPTPPPPPPEEYPVQHTATDYAQPVYPPVGYVRPPVDYARPEPPPIQSAPPGPSVNYARPAEAIRSPSVYSNSDRDYYHEPTYLPEEEEEPKTDNKKARRFFSSSTPTNKPAAPLLAPEPERRGPQPAPADEKPSYQQKTPYDDEERGRSCCCYNPALTCCSVFGMLVSLAFLAAGIALMIASKVVQDKCSGCSDTSFTSGDCNAIECSTTLHDGLLYGGAVVTGLAGIAVIWRLMMWCCTGYSSRK